METSDAHALTGAYALDALDDVERVAFERHLDGCSDCREEVRGLQETMVRLARGAAVAPPRRVRSQVLIEIGRTPQLRPPNRAPRVTFAAETRRPGGMWFAAAAGLLLLALGSGGVAVNQYHAAQQAQQDAAGIVQVVGARDAHLVSAPIAGGGAATLVVAGNRAVFATTSVPSLTDGRVYQLWIMRPAAAISVGLAPADRIAAGSWSRLMQGVRPGDLVGVSVEPSGGSDQPTTAPIVTLKV